VSKGGLIIRLVDVVLLLLLGFLLISDIVHKEQIRLPGPTGTKINLTEKSQILPIDIHIVEGDTVLPDVNPETEYSLKKLAQLYCYYLVYEEEKVYYIRKIDKLEEHLQIAQATYDSISVIINPHPNSLIQGTINLIDICRRHGLNRKFKYNE
jgi:biopolymer transport protein ExbD